jgi:protein transport protein SEC61 subunit gamma-like protein
MSRISDFIRESVRVLRLTKKPTKDDFFFIAKTTGLGLLLLGFVGYVVESIRWIFG